MRIDQCTEISQCDEYVALGAQHLILNVDDSWNLTTVEKLLRWRQSNR